MFFQIEKRDGRRADFNAIKITQAIRKATNAVGEDDGFAPELTQRVIDTLKSRLNGGTPKVEEVQDVVEEELIKAGYTKIAKTYILYREKRSMIRDGKSELTNVISQLLKETSRENANVGHSPSAKMLQIASAASKHYYVNHLIPGEFVEAYEEGEIHIHDLDYYDKTPNCLQIDLDSLLINGFNTGYGYIRPPKRIDSATAQAAIILQSNQNDMFGGQSFPHFDRSLAKVVRTFPRCPSEEEIFQSMEALVYNLNTMHSRAGSQVPFSSINIGSDTSKEGRAVSMGLLRAFKAGLGKGESPIFPNLVFRLKTGINLEKGDPNFDIYEQAIKVAAKRMNPSFSFMDCSINAKYGDEVAYMGCRTRVIGNRHGTEQSAKRGNGAPVTINLPRVALKGPEKFFENLMDTMDICVKQLIHRYRVLCSLSVRDLPFLMGQELYLGSEGLGPEDSIKPALDNATWAIGIIGLAEALIVLTGSHHGESEESQALGLQIAEAMKKRVDEFCHEHDMNVTLYATPAEGLAGRFVPIDRMKYGTIPGVTDKEYYTNSYHVPVSSEISMAKKIEVEGPYHKLFNAGHISYVEFPSPPIGNPEAVDLVIREMAKNDVGYGAINFPIDECKSCGMSGIIDLECERCGSIDIRRVRRITGYLSTIDRFNEGKKSELSDRVAHIGPNEKLPLE